jgi:hypothetical protein
MTNTCVLSGRSGRRFSLAAAALGLLAGGSAALAQKQAEPVRPERQALAAPVQIDQIDTMRVVLHPSTGRAEVDPGSGGVVRGPGCPPTVASHTNADFTGGSYVAQAGLVANESAAATYTLPAAAFPIKIDLLEFIVVTSNAATQVEFRYTISVWEGTPATGTLVASYTATNEPAELPFAYIGPGTAGVNIQVSIDPGDPEQIFIYNDGGSNRFSIAITKDPSATSGSCAGQATCPGGSCAASAPTCCNAFPCTDTGGLQQSASNWLEGLNCGALGCPPSGGWSTFQALNVLCRPSGDWVMRATWSSVNCVPEDMGSCCVSGICSVNTSAECQLEGGTWTLNGFCNPNPCPSTTGACCFGNSCQILEPAVCSGFGGTFIGLGVACGAGGVCPLGACCMPDGSCTAAISGPACAGMGGAFQGVGSSCSPNSCPQPTGACCSSTNFCFALTEASCLGIPGATWQGPLTTCEPNPCGAAQTGACCIGGICVVVTEAECSGANSSFAGVGTSCNDPGNNTSPCCRADFNQDTDVAVPDIFAFLSAWFAGDASANFDGEGSSPTVPDIFAFLSAWFAGCG